MRNLIVTDEMSKYQEVARKSFERKAVDLDAVQIGWKLHTGRVIVCEGKELEIVGEPQALLYDIVVNAPENGIVNRKGQANLPQLAHLILAKNAVVYYSK